jgi:hypothetical protein
LPWRHDGRYCKEVTLRGSATPRWRRRFFDAASLPWSGKTSRAATPIVTAWCSTRRTFAPRVGDIADARQAFPRTGIYESHSNAVAVASLNDPVSQSAASAGKGKSPVTWIATAEGGPERGSAGRHASFLLRMPGKVRSGASTPANSSGGKNLLLDYRAPRRFPPSHALRNDPGCGRSRAPWHRPRRCTRIQRPDAIAAVCNRSGQILSMSTGRSAHVV